MFTDMYMTQTINKTIFDSQKSTILILYYLLYCPHAKMAMVHV